MDIKENIEECWDWTSYIRPSGYGGYWTSITTYMLSKGSIPVQHLYNNPICCNLNHLELETILKICNIEQSAEDTTIKEKIIQTRDLQMIK